MKKGSLTHAIWTIIEIVFIIVAVVIIIRITGVLNDWSEARANAGSAALLSDAINDVCNHKDIDPNYKRTVQIWMPQSNVDSFLTKISTHIPITTPFIGGGIDPKWVIYYGDGVDAKEMSSEAGGEALDIAEIVGQKLNWDHFPRECSNDDHTICYGFFERDLKPQDSNLKIPRGCNVTKFWIMSPCYANVTVYYDGSEVNFCYKSWKGPDRKTNYCYGYNPPEGTFWNKINDFLGKLPSGLITLNRLTPPILKNAGYGNLIKEGWPYPDYSVFKRYNQNKLVQKICH